MKSDLVKFREILAQLPFDKYWQIGIETGELLKKTILENKFKSRNRSSIQKNTVREVLNKITKIIS